MIPASISCWALPRQAVDPAGLFTATPLGDDSYHLALAGDGSTCGSTTRKGWANLHPIQAGFAYHRGVEYSRAVRELGWTIGADKPHQTAEAFESLILRGQRLHEGRLFDWFRHGFFGSVPS